MTATLKLTATWVGQAVPPDLISAIVLSPFSKGAYVRVGDSVLAIGDIPAGPLHIAVAPVSQTVAERVLAEGDQLEVDVSSAKEWHPDSPDLRQLRGAARVVARLPQLHSAPSDVESVWPDVVAAAACGDLHSAGQLLEGRGSGLTPTGDDVLAGLLLIDAFSNRDPVRLTERLTLVAAAQTTDLSRSFLHWAVQGQSIEPVHRFLDCAAAGDRASTFAVAEEVTAIGATSGHAILCGLALGLGSLHRSEQGQSALGGKSFTQMSR